MTDYMLSRQIRDGCNSELAGRQTEKDRKIVHHRHQKDLHHLRPPSTSRLDDHPSHLGRKLCAFSDRLHSLTILQRRSHGRIPVQRPRHSAQFLRDHLWNGQHLVLFRWLAVDEDRGDFDEGEQHLRHVEVRVLDSGFHVRFRVFVLPRIWKWQVAKVQFRRRPSTGWKRIAAVEEQSGVGEGKGDFGVGSVYEIQCFWIVRVNLKEMIFLARFQFPFCICFIYTFVTVLFFIIKYMTECALFCFFP